MIIGFRCFRLLRRADGSRLGSSAASYIWTPGTNTAEHFSELPTYLTDCGHPPADRPATVALGHNTHCGFWAYNKPTLARDHNGGGSWVTVGAVLGWGNYSIGTDGWRCQYARILALSHAMWDEMEELSEHYRVPLCTFKGLPEFASHFGVTSRELDTKYDIPMALPAPPSQGDLYSALSPLTRYQQGSSWTPSMARRHYWSQPAIQKLTQEVGLVVTPPQCACGWDMRLTNVVRYGQDALASSRYTFECRRRCGDVQHIVVAG